MGLGSLSCRFRSVFGLGFWVYYGHFGQEFADSSSAA